jgi:3-hydroxymyristoyl/3-hydroxydecanoyl-(acyl carrier protein) dehydratase
MSASEKSPQILSLDHDAVLETIPHRPPFLFIDTVPELVKGNRGGKLNRLMFLRLASEVSTNN